LRIKWRGTFAPKSGWLTVTINARNYSVTRSLRRFNLILEFAKIRCNYNLTELRINWIKYSLKLLTMRLKLNEKLSRIKRLKLNEKLSRIKRQNLRRLRRH